MKWNKWLFRDFKQILISLGKLVNDLGKGHEGKLVMKSASLELHQNVCPAIVIGIRLTPF